MNVLLVGLLFVLIAGEVSAQCPSTGDWEIVEGQCMYCSGDDVTAVWRLARQVCLERGGFLTSIHNDAQLNFAQNCRRPSRDVWVGFVAGSFGGGNPAPGSEGWMDGTPYDFPFTFFTRPATSDCFELQINNDLFDALNCDTRKTFVCSRAYETCAALGQFPNAAVGYNTTALENGEYYTSTMASVTCNDGYVLSGDATRTCTGDNTWNTPATLSTCSPVVCGPLSNPANGEVIVQATTFASLAVYVCNDDFNMTGSPTRTCGADRQWSGAAPTCAAEDNNLSDLEIGLIVTAGVLSLALALLVLWALCRPQPMAMSQMAQAYPGARPPMPYPVAPPRMPLRMSGLMQPAPRPYGPRRFF